MEPATSTPLTQEQVDAIIAWVHYSGAQRARTQGKDFHEVDFLVGAMTVFFALQSQGSIPAGWIFGPMSGQSVLSPSEA